MGLTHADKASLATLEHFVDLACAGRCRGASTGQIKARKLAVAILENAPGLDESAIEGAVQWLQQARLNLTQARELIGA